MRFQVLGPMRVWDGNAWSPVRAAQQRTVLAVLLVGAGRAVSMDRLVDEIWGERPPRAATSTVHGYVMRLRRLLGDDVLLTRPGGYELVVGDEDLDAAVFERLVDDARRRAAERRLEVAAGQLAEAAELWRGPAFADVPAGPVVAAEADRLDQRRLTVLEQRFDVELELGRHADLVDELHRLADAHPLRERLRAQHLLALYRCGRRAEALAAYRAACRTLADEFGVRPGPELRDLERAIREEDAGPLAVRPAPAGVTPAQLPAIATGFTGRTEHLRRLDALLASGPDGLVIAAIDGPAGVGKTALAVHWAHQVRDHFPDGQLHVNLLGYAPGQPLRPIDALARFLRALDVPAERIPVDADEAAALYRSALAGRRVLVLLDNAHHADQVRPLLPGGAGSLVLVTSRDRLGGLVAWEGAVRLPLDVLTEEEAALLLTGQLGPDRVFGEPDATAELADLCGRLPLALRIAAANLTARPGTSIGGYARLLADGDRLSMLEVGGDPRSAVRVAFDHSYAALPAPAQLVFRRLGLAPGQDVTPAVAAALAGTTEAAAAAELDRLAGAHLADEHATGRYTLHDLLRRYATVRVIAEDPAPDREQARTRLYRHYLHRLDAAASLLYPQVTRLPPPPANGTRRPTAGDGLSRRVAGGGFDGTVAETGAVAGDGCDGTAAAGVATGDEHAAGGAAAEAGAGTGFDGHAAALAWLDAERVNLVAAVHQAATSGRGEFAWRLADALRGYLYMRMHTVDWAAVAHAALAAAEAAGSPHAQAAARLSIATLHGVQDRYHESIEHFRPALALSRQVGWTEGEAAILGNLGAVYDELGQLAEAARHYREALVLARRVGGPATEALNLDNLGLVYLRMGEPDRAADHFTRALDLYRVAGSRSGEARTTANLGGAYRALGRHDEACDLLAGALDLHREVGNRHNEPEVTCALAAAHGDAGRLDRAMELAGRALRLSRELADRRVEADALTAMATVHHRRADLTSAAAGHRRALALAREIGNRHTEATALLGLAAVHHESGDAAEAATAARAARAIARQAGFLTIGHRAADLLAALPTS